MQSWTDAAVVNGKIVSQGASRELDLDDEFSVWFSIMHRERRRYFQIPPPPMEGGYTEAQLETIELELLKFGLDLLPLDHNLMC